MIIDKKKLGKFLEEFIECYRCPTFQKCNIKSESEYDLDECLEIVLKFVKKEILPDKFKIPFVANTELKDKIDKSIKIIIPGFLVKSCFCNLDKFIYFEKLETKANLWHFPQVVTDKNDFQEITITEFLELSAQCSPKETEKPPLKKPLPDWLYPGAVIMACYRGENSISRWFAVIFSHATFMGFSCSGKSYDFLAPFDPKWPGYLYEQTGKHPQQIGVSEVKDYAFPDYEKWEGV